MPIDASIYNNVQLPPSPIQQMGQLAQLKSEQQRQQMGALEIQQKTQQMAAETALNNAMSSALDASGNIDEQKFGQLIKNTPAASKWPEIQQHFVTMREARQKMAAGEADHMGAIAAAADAAGTDPSDKAAVLVAGITSGIQTGAIPRDHGLANIQDIIDENGNPDPQKVAAKIATMRAASKQRTELDTARMTAETRKTAEARQGAEAIAKAPLTTAQIAEAQARVPLIQAETEKNKAETAKLTQAALPAGDMGIQSDMRTTATGRQYVDLSKYKGKDYPAALQQAHALGIKGVSAGESDALQNIDTARQNMAEISKSLHKLPTSSSSRLYQGPINKLEAMTQMDPELAAWGTYRSAAIQAMRAMAGAKGLRINKSEIETAMANDIPEITDTQATAKEKISRVSKMLANQETGILGAASSTPSAAASAAPAGRVRVVGPKGETGTAPAGATLPDGWKRQ